MRLDKFRVNLSLDLDLAYPSFIPRITRLFLSFRLVHVLIRAISHLSYASFELFLIWVILHLNYPPFELSSI